MEWRGGGGGGEKGVGVHCFVCLFVCVGRPTY